MDKKAQRLLIKAGRSTNPKIIPGPHIPPDLDVEVGEGFFSSVDVFTGFSVFRGVSEGVVVVFGLVELDVFSIEDEVSPLGQRTFAERLA